jgi:hypothetical protein
MIVNMSTTHEDGEEGSEYVYDEMSAVRRYYNDIHEEDTPAVNTFISLENLLKAYGMIDDTTATDALANKVFMISKSITDPRTIREQYILLPLDIMSSYIDMTLDTAAQKEWYMDTIGYAVSWLADDHDDTCIEGTESVSPACITSKECPMVFMNQLLVSGVIDYDFDKAEYAIDPIAAYDSASMKLKVAKKNGLINEKVAKTKQHEYDMAFVHRFPEETMAIARKEQSD